MQDFDIFAKLKEFEEDFENGKLVIARANTESTARFLKKDSPGGYVFNQADMINDIDLAINSVYKKGRYDTEGQRKVYLNIVRFIRDVSRMRTDIDTKNYVFNPDTYEDYWPVYFMSRKFRVWTREENYGEILNRIGDDYSTYGTAVLKKIGKKVDRVPLRSLKNTQDAKTLKDAVRTGGYVIECHEMTLSEIEEMKEWDSDGLEYGKKYKVKELYTLVPRYVIDKHNGKQSEDKKMVQCMAILIPEEEGKASENGKVLFIEQIDEAPYEEARWSTQDGRWLGVGPVEDQLENQVARNLIANMRRKANLHSSKRIYQSQDDEIPKNLVKDVRDGQVIKVGPQGGITAVPNEARNFAQLEADDAVWKENTQQKSFTFEVATGEAMPSGTPFRLGVILSNAVESHFQLKKEQLGLFLKRSFFSQLVPVFQKQSKEHTLAISSTAENIETLRDSIITLKTNERYVDALINAKPGENINKDAIKQEVTEEAMKSPYYFIDIPENYYKNLKYHMELDITDEATDTAAEVETLTNLFTTMMQKGDPRADRVLEAILAKTGKNLQSIAGPMKNPTPMQMPQGVPSELPALAQPAPNAAPTL